MKKRKKKKTKKKRRKRKVKLMQVMMLSEMQTKLMIPDLELDLDREWSPTLMSIMVAIGEQFSPPFFLRFIGDFS